MEPELSEVDEITQALDYLADQTYSDEQLKILMDCLLPIDMTKDIDAIKEDFAGNRGVISRIRTVMRFVEKYQTNEELIKELQSEMEYLMAGIQGQTGGGISL